MIKKKKKQETRIARTKFVQRGMRLRSNWRRVNDKKKKKQETRIARTKFV